MSQKKIRKDINKIIADAQSIGIANHYKVRNIEIKRKFRALREKHIKYDDALTQLASEYFLSLSSIQQIIQGYKKSEH